MNHLLIKARVENYTHHIGLYNQHNDYWRMSKFDDYCKCYYKDRILNVASGLIAGFVTPPKPGKPSYPLLHPHWYSYSS